MTSLPYTSRALVLLIICCFCIHKMRTAPITRTFMENGHHPNQNGNTLQNGTAHLLLRVAVIAPLHESIPPKPTQNGRIEKAKTEMETAETVHNLVEGLVKRGHQVTLFASADSHTTAELISNKAYAAIRDRRAIPGEWNHPYLWMLEQMEESINNFDILHFHTIEHFAHLGPSFIGKTLTTLYNQPGGGTVDQLLEPLGKLFPSAPIAVSEIHVKEAEKYWENVFPLASSALIKSENIAEKYEKIYYKFLNGEKMMHWENNGNEAHKKQKQDHPIQNGFVHERDQRCINIGHRPLYIAIVSPPILDALPPKKSGGTERIVYYLTEELHKLGHKVTLFAPNGTETSADLIEIPHKTNPWEGKGNWVHHMLPVIYSQEFVKRRASHFDILHFHDSDHYILQRDFLSRSVTTRHMPIDDATFFNTFSHIPMVSISEQQRRHAPKGAEAPLPLNWVATVHNGIPLGMLKFRAHSSDSESVPYLAWMGRMVPEKGIGLAIEFALQAGMQLRIAAQIVDEYKFWWEYKVKPIIAKNAEMIVYVGEIGDEEKNDFLGNALAFLCTPKWDEPFGLSMIEAMATGTPAIANRRGAVPEIVKEGINGFMFDFEGDSVKNSEKVRKIVSEVEKLDRSEVRAVAEQRWSLQQMARNYVEVYRNMLSKQCEGMEVGA